MVFEHCPVERRYLNGYEENVDEMSQKHEAKGAQLHEACDESKSMFPLAATIYTNMVRYMTK